MLAKKSVTTMRIDEDVKKQSKALFDSLGLDFTTAVTLFLKKSIDVNGLPFEMKVTNPDTLEAIEEMKRGDVIKYGSFEDFEKDMLGE